jgi:capsid protein
MKLTSKIAAFFTSRWMTSFGGGGYEAAKTNTTRSNIDLAIQNARQDISKVTRRELLRKARYLHRNSPIVRGLIERLVTFTIGTGLHPIPTTSNPEWNSKAIKSWKGWAKRPDIESKLSFEAIQAVLFRSLLIDGDIFTLNTYGDTGRPRIQLIESHDITSRMTASDDPDGLELDIRGRPINYIFREDSKIDAEFISHFYLPERAGQKRGITILAAIINYAHDLDDILVLEKQAVKEGSSKTDIIKTADGELRGDDSYIGKSVQDADSENSIEEITRYYREVFSSEAKVMRKGDEFDPYISGRPSPSWQGFIHFIVELICIGPGLPPSLLTGDKVGGADTRREVATAQRIIEMWQGVFTARLQQIYEYVIEHDMKKGFLPGAPEDWRETKWQTPPKLTVDAGREAASDREDVKMGLLNRSTYFSRWGKDWREEMIQSAIEAAFIKDLAKTYEVERGEIVLLDPNELAKNEPMDPKTPEPKQPFNKSKKKR